MHNARNLYGRGMSPAEHSVVLCYRSPRTTKTRVVLRISACAANDPVADFGKRQKALHFGKRLKAKPHVRPCGSTTNCKKDRRPDPRIAATCLSLLIAHIFAQQGKARCSSHNTAHLSRSLSHSDSVSPYISLLLSSLVQVPLVPVTCRRRDALFGSRSQAVIEWREEVGCSRGHMDGGDEGLQASGRPSKPTSLPTRQYKTDKCSQANIKPEQNVERRYRTKVQSEFGATSPFPELQRSTRVLTIVHKQGIRRGFPPREPASHIQLVY